MSADFARQYSNLPEVRMTKKFQEILDPSFDSKPPHEKRRIARELDEAFRDLIDQNIALIKNLKTKSKDIRELRSTIHDKPAYDPSFKQILQENQELFEPKRNFRA